MEAHGWLEKTVEGVLLYLGVITAFVLIATVAQVCWNELYKQYIFHWRNGPPSPPADPPLSK